MSVFTIQYSVQPVTILYAILLSIFDKHWAVESQLLFVELLNEKITKYIKKLQFISIRVTETILMLQSWTIENKLNNIYFDDKKNLVPNDLLQYKWHKLY